MYSINVLIITYNQEGVIKRAVDSVLVQRQYGLKNIIVSDDCSTDKTWEILNDYKKQYPEIFILNRNKPNLGIIPNAEKIVSLRGTADFYVFLAGDDAFNDGYFKEIQRIVDQKKINPDDEAVIYFGWKSKYPDGSEKNYTSEIINKGVSPFSLYIRGMISGRGAVRTRGIYEKFTPVIMNKGLRLAESMFDSQVHRFAKKVYQSNFVANIYYAEVGVSTKLQKTDYYTEQALTKWEYFLENYAEDDTDRNFIRYKLAETRLSIDPNIKDFIDMVVYFIKGYKNNSGYGIKYLILNIYNIIKR